MPKGCYTCRRRRVKCDNNVPFCQKCQKTGRECLGYQKPLVWVKGVASRGKMMGLTFDDVTESSDVRDTDHRIGDLDGPRLGTTPDSLTSIEDASLPLVRSPNLFGREGGLILQHPDSLVFPTQTPSETSQDADGRERLPPLRGFVDPLFQDLDHLTRFYISYYDKEFTRVLALYDTSDNPWRKLIPFISNCPLLSDAIAASSACHYAFNDISHQNLSVSPPVSESSWAFPVTPSQDPTIQLVAKDLPESLSISPAYEHALRFKHRALRALSKSLRDPAERADDRVPAGILMLILLDSLESGGGAWRSHLEGAKSLLQSRGQSLALGKKPQESQAETPLEGLANFVIDSCISIEIMGSTLGRSGAYSRPLYFQLMGFTTLERLEETSFVGCPAPLLEIILFVDSLRHSYSEASSPIVPPGCMPPFAITSGSQSDETDLPSALLDHILSFDPVLWAENIEAKTGFNDYESRFHAASGYKIAVYLYAARVNSIIIPPQQHEEKVNNLFEHILAIPPTDELVKCTIWSTFIAGAESNSQAQRQAALDNLDKLWNVILSANLRSASMVLKTLWRRQAERREEQQQNGGNEANGSQIFNWIHELDRTKGNWLFI